MNRMTIITIPPLWFCLWQTRKQDKIHKNKLNQEITKNNITILNDQEVHLNNITLIDRKDYTKKKTTILQITPITSS